MDPAVAEQLRVAAEREQQWEEELRQCRLRFIARVKQATALTSPTRRYALYQQWRKEIGDTAARESAKFAEACLTGQVSISKIERMVK